MLGSDNNFIIDGRLDRAVHQWSLNPDWTKFGPERWPLSSNPAIARNKNGKLEVFMMGSDRQLYHSWQTAAGSSSGWVGSWAPIGGRVP